MREGAHRYRGVLAGGSAVRPAHWCAQLMAAQLVLAGAWVSCAAMWTGKTVSSGVSPGVWWCMPAMVSTGGGSVAGAAAAGVPAWLLMSISMTMPGVLPAAQHVAVNTFRRSRSRSLLLFFTVYLAVWAALGLAAQGLMLATGVTPSVQLFAVALALAAAYELTALKRRALNRCHRTVVLAPSGWRWAEGVSRFAWQNTSGCAAACVFSMAAMLAASGEQLLVMPALTAAMTYGRLSRRPDRARRRVAGAYTAAAALLLLACV